MDFVQHTILGVIALLGVYLSYLLHVLIREIKYYNHVDATPPLADELEHVADEHDSNVPEYIIARNVDFENRINELKHEVASQQPNIQKRGTVAEELHPGVHNLPHHSVKHGDYMPDVEVAE